jgi:hypothetical protein
MMIPFPEPFDFMRTAFGFWGMSVSTGVIMMMDKEDVTAWQYMIEGLPKIALLRIRLWGEDIGEMFKVWSGKKD